MIDKWKKFTAAALLAMALANPASAKNASADEAAEMSGADVGMVGKEKEMFDMLLKIFGGDENMQPIAPAQLALAQSAAGKILPDGALTKMMSSMANRIVTPMLAMIPEMSSMEIMGKTGIYEGAVENLDEQARKDITALLDPSRKENGRKLFDTMMPILNQAMASLEGPMRTGLSRAYARKFSAEQLGQINSFFATPTGSFFAAESYALQADPEVMQATIKAVPDMISQLMKQSTSLEKEVAKLDKGRALADLNDTEMAKLAGLLGVSVETLKEQSIAMAAADDAAEAASDTAVATDMSADDPYANETGEEPWYSEDNWDQKARKNVDALLATSDKASMKSSEAYSTWNDAYTKAVAEARERFLAKGWKQDAELK